MGGKLRKHKMSGKVPKKETTGLTAKYFMHVENLHNGKGWERMCYRLKKMASETPKQCLPNSVLSRTDGVENLKTTCYIWYYAIIFWAVSYKILSCHIKWQHACQRDGTIENIISSYNLYYVKQIVVKIKPWAATHASCNYIWCVIKS